MSETISMATEESAPTLTELSSPVLATDSVGEDTWASEGSLPTEPIRPVAGFDARTPTTYIDPRFSYHLVEEPGHPTRYRIANVGSETRVVAASPFVEADGVDNRVRITNTTMWPWSPHAHLVITYPDGNRYIGSATMVNRHHAITAGHVVYSAANGGWATSIQVNAAQDDATVPYGVAWATRMFSFTGWTTNQNRDWDVGMLVLNSDLGNTTGWMGLIWTADGNLANHQITVAGYPGDKGGQQLWAATAPIVTVLGDQLRYSAYTKGGDSGAGVFGIWSGMSGEHICADHVAGPNGVPNTGCRVTGTKGDRIVKEWFPA